jgi:hypothetical protein
VNVVHIDSEVSLQVRPARLGVEHQQRGIGDPHLDVPDRPIRTEEARVGLLFSAESLLEEGNFRVGVSGDHPRVDPRITAGHGPRVRACHRMSLASRRGGKP